MTTQLIKFYCILLLLASTRAATQAGHVWWFGSGTPPYASTPSTGNISANLTVLGSATITPGSLDVAWSGACTGGITSVAAFNKGAGFSFANEAPGAVATSYTIELIFKLNDTEDSSWRRLIGFYSLDSPTDPDNNDNGLYIDQWNGIAFYTWGLSNQYVTGGMAAETWHHLILVRDSVTSKVNIYHNGGYKGVFDDPNGHLVPRASNNDTISFFKDNEGVSGEEETSGKVAKIAVYNSTFSIGQVATLFASACDSFPLNANSQLAWSLTGNSNTTSANFIGTTTAQPVIIKANNAEALRIAPTGEVGIGDSATRSGYKLAVKGNVLAEKITVRAPVNWPDYVFDSTYRLPGLAEVSAYIKKHKHLPGVPSANQVEREGIEVSAHQALLLKKIEELTLYIIGMNETIELLKKENKELMRRVKKDKE